MSRQSGGINVGTGIHNVEGSVVGRDQTVHGAGKGGDALQPIMDALRRAPEEQRTLGFEIAKDLSIEAAKGAGAANDGILADLIKRLVALVPATATSIVSAFGSSLLAGVAGPVTGMVLDQLKRL